MATSRRDLIMGTLAAVPTLAAASVFAGAKAPAAPHWQLPAKRSVRVVENEWTPMSDGARLGARLWIPEGAERTPVPVVLEYIPYRKRDAYRPRDNRWGPQLAQYGIAYARVDVRGGSSSGRWRHYHGHLAGLIATLRRQGISLPDEA
jgi:uncharacterized protein